MAKIKDAEISNYANDSLQSNNESDDDIFPIATKKNTKKKRRQRKRSASLPFIEDHTGLCKELAAAKGLQLMKTKGSRQSTRKRKEWEDCDEMTESNKAFSEQSSTRRSASMPEFYQFSPHPKDELPKHYTKTKRSASRSRNKLVVAETDADLDDGESFKLPVISGCVSSKNAQEQNTENEVDRELSQTVKNMTIQRKTYLPRINPNNGNTFMKSR